MSEGSLRHRCAGDPCASSLCFNRKWPHSRSAADTAPGPTAPQPSNPFEHPLYTPRRRTVARARVKPWRVQAITLGLPPQSGQVSISIANTRLSRCAQVIGASGLSCSTRPCGRRGTIRARCLQFGAKTRATASLTCCLRCAQDVRSLSPALWKRVRLSPGRGTRAASLAMAALAHPPATAPALLYLLHPCSRAPAAYRSS